jgi:hypothetical protein
MRFLLLIPVFVMFLSNVPFIQEMPMEKMMAIMEKQEEEKCCKNSTEEEVNSCHTPSTPGPEPEPMTCHPGTVPVEGTCLPTGSTCICICVFQFAATHEIKLIQFGAAATDAGHTGYLEVKWKDPHIVSPGQPPDFI